MTEQTLKAKIQADMKAAMKAKDSDRLSTIRMLLAAIKQREIDEKTTLSDADVLSVINKMIKQRKDAAKQYHDANRPELAEKEEQEIKYLEVYLPQQLTEAEVTEAVEAAITETGASSIKDMGAVMNMLRPKIQGRADMGAVSGLVRAKLQ